MMQKLLNATNVKLHEKIVQLTIFYTVYNYFAIGLMICPIPL